MNETTCLHCGKSADGRLRAAIWEEEERGRLAARNVILCASCHGKFLSGDLGRVELARRYHENKNYQPAEWVARIDRDSLLDIACLYCGVLLPLDTPRGDRVICPHCHAANLFGERKSPVGVTVITVSLEEIPAVERRSG